VIVTPAGGRRLDAVLVGAIALALRLGVVAWARDKFPAVEDGHYYDVLARRLAAGAGYTWAWPDGAVTFAAHYPVGYPALLAGAYALLGASAGTAMLVNALVGAAGAAAVHRLVDGEGVARWRPLAAGLAVAAHPALLLYTPAVMTEGVTASLVVVAAALAARARTGGWRWIAASGAVMGLACLVRPQSLLLAPVLGALGVAAPAGARARAAGATLLTVVALTCLAPWTVRNCARMGRCALVSVNGGWNLLIGASTDTGAWQPVAVPAECATVWDEAGKDVCFDRAARRTIVRAPGEWLARVPAKIGATLDYFGAAPWYLHASNPAAFGDDAKLALAQVETVASRLALLGALAACAFMAGPRGAARRGVALLGAAAAVSPHGWPAYAAVVVCVALAGRRAWLEGPMIVPCVALVIVATAGVHAVFFGAGRYGLAVVPFVTGLAFCARRVVAQEERGGSLRAGAGEGTLGGVDAARVIAGMRLWRRREESPSSTEHDAG
jgi:hypothetical protein